MHKGVKFSGTIVYSFAIAYVLGIAFGYLIPLMIIHPWLTIASYLMTGIFIIGIMYFLGSLLFKPLCYLIISPPFKIIPFIILMISATSTLSGSWKLISSPTFTTYLTVIIADTFILAVYSSLLWDLLRLNVPETPAS